MHTIRPQQENTIKWYFTPEKLTAKEKITAFTWLIGKAVGVTLATYAWAHAAAYSPESQSYIGEVLLKMWHGVTHTIEDIWNAAMYIVSNPSFLFNFSWDTISREHLDVSVDVAKHVWDISSSWTANLIKTPVKTLLSSCGLYVSLSLPIKFFTDLYTLKNKINFLQRLRLRTYNRFRGKGESCIVEIPEKWDGHMTRQ